MDVSGCLNFREISEAWPVVISCLVEIPIESHCGLNREQSLRPDELIDLVDLSGCRPRSKFTACARHSFPAFYRIPVSSSPGMSLLYLIASGISRIEVVPTRHITFYVYTRDHFDLKRILINLPRIL